MVDGGPTARGSVNGVTGRTASSRRQRSRDHETRPSAAAHPHSFPQLYITPINVPFNSPPLTTQPQSADRPGPPHVEGNNINEHVHLIPSNQDSQQTGLQPPTMSRLITDVGIAPLTVSLVATSFSFFGAGMLEVAGPIPIIRNKVSAVNLKPSHRVAIWSRFFQRAAVRCAISHSSLIRRPADA